MKQHNKCNFILVDPLVVDKVGFSFTTNSTSLKLKNNCSFVQLSVDHF